MHCMPLHTNENIWMNYCLRMLSRCVKIICRADNPRVMVTFTFLLLALSRSCFYNCSAAYWNLPGFLRNRMDGTLWMPWRLWGLTLGCLVKCGLEVDQGKGTRWVYKCCFLSSPPFGTLLWARGLISAPISVILSLLTFCSLSSICLMKPNSQAGCPLLQFFSKYDQESHTWKETSGDLVWMLIPWPSQIFWLKVSAGCVLEICFK